MCTLCVKFLFMERNKTQKGITMSQANSISSKEHTRMVCKEQAENYLKMIRTAITDAKDLDQWSNAICAEEIAKGLEGVIDFASNQSDWDSSSWSFSCADSNLESAESFLGIE